MRALEFLRPAKNVPTTWWSAEDPWTLKPRISTTILLIIGLIIFGAGDAVLISARLGNTPWTVLAEGIAKNLDLSIGKATFLVSFLVLLIWIPLKEKPGIGTILNAILIAATIEFYCYFTNARDVFITNNSGSCWYSSGRYGSGYYKPRPRSKRWSMTGLPRLLVP